jgi:hypothetical protein
VIYAQDGRALLSDEASVTTCTWQIDEFTEDDVAGSTDAYVITAAAFAPLEWHSRRSSVLAIGGGWHIELYHLDPETLLPLRTSRVNSVLPYEYIPAHHADITALAISPTGYLLSGGDEGLLKVWSPYGGELVRILGLHNSTINHVAITADGEYGVSAAWDGLKVWRWRTGEVLYTFPSAAHFAVAENGTWLAAVSGSYDERLSVWNLTDGVLLGETPLEATAACVAVTNDGSIAVGDHAGQAHGYRLLAHLLPYAAEIRPTSRATQLTSILTASPSPPMAIDVLSVSESARTLCLVGSAFPDSWTTHAAPVGRGVQFCNLRTGELSLVFDQEVSWLAPGGLFLDMGRIRHLLWAEEPLFLVARIIGATDGIYDPLSNWSPAFVVHGNGQDRPVGATV